MNSPVWHLQNMTIHMPFKGMLQYAVRDRWRLKNGWILGKFQSWVEGHSNPKIYVTDFGPLNRAFWAWYWKKLQHDFPKMRGGRQRLFGTFPKIHPFWRHYPSLSNWTCTWIMTAHVIGQEGLGLTSFMWFSPVAGSACPFQCKQPERKSKQGDNCALYRGIQGKGKWGLKSV